MFISFRRICIKLYICARITKNTAKKDNPAIDRKLLYQLTFQMYMIVFASWYDMTCSSYVKTYQDHHWILQNHRWSQWSASNAQGARAGTGGAFIISSNIPPIIPHLIILQLKSSKMPNPYLPTHSIPQYPTVPQSHHRTIAHPHRRRHLLGRHAQGSHLGRQHRGGCLLSAVLPEEDDLHLVGVELRRHGGRGRRGRRGRRSHRAGVKTNLWSRGGKESSSQVTSNGQGMAPESQWNFVFLGLDSHEWP